ncbi:hypothetical protein AB1L07_02625 [Niallia alba]|uniref:hypothetical protein n=1 Tax=Niallia alba TaxID=2729105 RepID=UPI00399FD758
MSNLLTTGQMIDGLVFGEIAETSDKKYQARKTEYGSICISNEHGNVGLNPTVLSAKWRKLPKFVRFGEAMEALNGGRDVTLHLSEEGKPETTLFRTWFHLETREGITFADMFDGKWTIEN